MRHAIGLFLGTALFLSAAPVCAQSSGLPQGLPGESRTPDSAAREDRRSYIPENPIRGQSVAQRSRQNFDPRPLSLGSFQLFPALELGEYYDSNIYATRNDAEGDFVSIIQPKMSLVSDWGRHALSLEADVDSRHYADNDDEDNTNGQFDISGRYDIAHETWLSAHAGYGAYSESRSNPSAVSSSEKPVRYYIGKTGVDAYRGTGRLTAKLGYDRLNYLFEDPDMIGGGRIDLSGRDRTDHILGSELSYKVTGNFKPFVAASYDIHDYDSNPVRDSDGYNLRLGSRNDWGGVVTTEAYIGQLSRTYDDMNGGDIDTIDYGGNVLWNITPLTSIEGRVDRYIGETTLGGQTNPDGASGYLTTEAEVTIMHELRRDVVVEAHYSASENDFEGNSGRVDMNYNAGTGVRYLISRNFYGDLTYNYTERDTNTVSGDYQKHNLFLRIGVQY